MSPLSKPIVIPAPYVRSFAITALMGATILATPLTAALADGARNAPIQLAQAAASRDQTTAATAETKAETVEQRISTLHAELEITAGEEADWNNVAQAMRANAAAMQKLIAENPVGDLQTMTAVEDLKTYGKFAQAHVDGLKSLTASFETLYDSMPDAQKKVADQVFQNRHREGTPAHS
jgi:periplasmic protein CpxP/Spy